MTQQDNQKLINELRDAVAERTKLKPEQSEKVILAILRNGWSLTHIESQQAFAINPEAPDDDDLTVVEETKEVADESVESSDDGGNNEDVQGE